MGSPNPVTELSNRVDGLEKEIRQLNDELATEQRERQASEAKLDKQMQQLAAALSDNNAAIEWAIKYLNQLDAQFFAKQQMMQEAIKDFNDFLNLPAKSNSYLALWDFAFSVLSTVVPSLRLFKAVEEMEKAAAVELASAKAFMKTPKLEAKVTAAVARGHEIADVIAKNNDIRDKVEKATGTDEKETPRADAVLKSRTRQLIKESNQAHGALDRALDALAFQFRARVLSIVYDIPYDSKGSLEALAKRLLPPLPHYFTEEELESVGLQYKWEIFKKWAPDSLLMVHEKSAGTWFDFIEGLNDAQGEQIGDWFNSGVIRNQYFVAPVVVNVWWAAKQWGVREITRGSDQPVDGPISEVARWVFRKR